MNGANARRCVTTVTRNTVLTQKVGRRGLGFVRLVDERSSCRTLGEKESIYAVLEGCKNSNQEPQSPELFRDNKINQNTLKFESNTSRHKKRSSKEMVKIKCKLFNDIKQCAGEVDCVQEFYFII